MQVSTSAILLSLGFPNTPTPCLLPHSKCQNEHDPCVWISGIEAQHCTDCRQPTDLLLQLLLKTWLFVQARCWNIWFGAGQAELTNWIVAHNRGREMRNLWYHWSTWLVFSADIFSVHSRPLTAESATASAVKLLQWEGDKVKDLLEGQCQEMAETSHDRGCALCSSGTIYLRARLHQTPPRAVLASYVNYLTHLQ